MKHCIFIAVFSLLHQLSSAQDSIVPAEIKTDRPDQTESAFIVPAKMFQFETGFQFEEGSNHEKSFLLPTVLTKYGVNRNFELRLIFESVVDRSDGVQTSGINQIVVGFKVALAEEKGIIPQTSFIGHLGLANLASKPYKTDYYAPAFRFLMEHTLSDKVSLGYNLGAEWDGFSPEPVFIYTLTTAFALTEKFGVFTEIYGFAPQNGKADHRADAGCTFLVSNNFMIDASGGFGITNNAPNYFISAGFSFRI